ncbi:MAG: protein MpaA [Ilumatobacter sp.]|jgi:protein MpaA
MSTNVLSGTRVLVAAAALLFAACAGSDDTVGDAASDSTITVASTITVTTTTVTPTTAPAATTTAPAIPATTSSTTTASTTTSTIPSTTIAPTTTIPPLEDALPVFDFASTQLAVGTSIEGRPISADRYGMPGGRRVLVIGVIHGDEDAGVAIIDELRQREIPDGVELWLVESMNPDGQAAQDRQNANRVDLNRNFPHKWGVIGEPGNSQYAGTGPASEPETQAMVNLITQLRPDITIWYHQDANLIIPSTGRDGRIRARYAELTALPLADCCGGGGVYTGIAATWARVELKQTSDAVPFIVELPGGDLTAEQVDAHTTAVLTVAAEG